MIDRDNIKSTFEMITEKCEGLNRLRQQFVSSSSLTSDLLLTSIFLITLLVFDIFFVMMEFVEKKEGNGENARKIRPTRALGLCE